jgi:hypothetical protein
LENLARQYAGVELTSLQKQLKRKLVAWYFKNWGSAAPPRVVDGIQPRSRYYFFSMETPRSPMLILMPIALWIELIAQWW